LIRAAALVLIAAAGCRSMPLYRAPVGPDAQATYAAIVADGHKRIAPEDEALWACELGSAALQVGAEAEAFKALHRASRIMATLESTSSENARAILGAEATKTWKGDPYERCMNALYKGLLYWRRGDLDNASASFKRGLLADAWSEVGKSQEDFAALSFLLGWVSWLRGKDEQARYSFKAAAGIKPNNPYLADPHPDRDNVLIVADVGRGPKKYADGPGGSIARFAPYDTPDKAIAVLVDGKRAGRSRLATDLFHQAITRGKKVIDGIRQGKAVFKVGTAVTGAVLLNEGLRRRKNGMAATGAGLLVLSALTNAKADTRYWSQLPGAVQILPLKIRPGRHRLTVRALNSRGVPIPGWSRTFDVTVPDGPGTLYWFSTGRDRTIHGLTDPPTQAKASP